MAQVNILAHATDVPISRKELTRLKNLLKKYRAKDPSKPTESSAQPLASLVERKAPSHREDAEHVGSKPSFRSEDTEESVLQDAIEEDLTLTDVMNKVSMNSADSIGGSAQCVRDQNMSNADEQDPDFDSEATESVSLHGSEDSKDENLFEDDTGSSSCNEEISVVNSCGAQWDIFRRQDVPKLLEYLRRHSNEFSRLHCTTKPVR